MNDIRATVVLSVLLLYVSTYSTGKTLPNRDVCNALYEAVMSEKRDGSKTPSPIDVNYCLNDVQGADTDCPIDASSCSNNCSFLGYETDKSGCVISCDCSSSGLYEEDIKYDLIDVIYLKQAYEARYEDIAHGPKMNMTIWNGVRIKSRVKIPYVFDDSLSAKGKTAISNAFSRFSKKTCIDFVPHTDEKDYIEFLSEGGCWSYVGCRGGKQPISIGFGCEWDGVVQHEIMHALGFWHEQSRPDRDQYVTIVKENIRAGKENNFNTRTFIDSLGSAYDTSSLMHYSGYAFSSNNLPTILDKSTNKPVRSQRKKFANTDVEQINALYECRTKVSTTSTTTHLPSVWSEWKEWSICSVTCGGGIQTRLRQCVSRSDEAIECPGSPAEERACQTTPCITTTMIPGNGTWGPWSNWFPCSKSCGNGYQWRFRECSGAVDSGNCDDAMWSGQACNTQSCNVIPETIALFYGAVWSSNKWFCDFGRVVTGDFNGDGKEDLLCYYPDNFMRLKFGVEKGEYSIINWQDFSKLCDTFTEELRHILVGDLNNDGLDDLLCHEKQSGKMQVLFYNRDIHFGSKKIDWEGNAPKFCNAEDDILYCADANGDSLSDLICKNSSGYISVMLNKFE
ncbi:uncharacterized protein LOC143449371 [Clavelina lepadiformis]|uniref:uncharacterized protein LOC143449371 n=1 Tax=Clavelina lepadiformis TaxID=159417 RepID=UPI004041495C